MDFTAAKPVGRDLARVDGGGEPGYDHCFCRGGDASRPGRVAEIARLEVRALLRCQSGPPRASRPRRHRRCCRTPCRGAA